MSEKEPGTTKKQKSPRTIGPISPQWQTFGSDNGEEESASAVQTSEGLKVQTSERPDIQTSRNSEGGNAKLPEVQTSSPPDTRKSKHPDWKQQTIYLPPALAKWLKVHAAQAELEISEIVVMALKDYQERYP